MHDWLAGRNCRFLFVLAPNKETIYPALLPAAAAPVRRPSIMDLLAADLARGPDSGFVDLRPVMRRAAAAAPLYFRTDTHWNALGALAAYQEVAARLRTWYPGMPVPSLSGYGISWREGAGGDLSRMMGMQDDLRESVPVLTPLKGA